MNLATKISLDICIPTYQRSNECIRQLNFLTNEIASLVQTGNAKINIIVRDNNSDEQCYLKVKERILQLQDLASESTITLEIFRNPSNLGLAGNLVQMLKRDAKSDFIWFVGDDDILHPGIITNILKNISHDHSLVFMNYDCIHKEYGTVKDSAFDAKDEKGLLNLFLKHDAIMMFITSCVYKRNILLESLNLLDKVDCEYEITIPLFWAFFSEYKGNVVYIDDIFISDVVSGISWGNVYNKVRLTLVPGEVMKLNHLGYNVIYLYYILLRYYLKNHRFLIGVILRLIVPNKIVDKVSRFIRR